MKKLISFSIIGLSLISLTLLNGSCTNSSPDNKTFTTKDDSLNFVKAVIKKYPEAQGAKIADFGKSPAKVRSSSKFDPIDWEKVKTYGGFYDKHPLIDGKKGFLIDAKGLELLRSNSAYKQIYLCLGKYTDDIKINNDYTIMIVPLDADTSVIHKGLGDPRPGQNSNYDYLDPCPVVCPKGF